MLYLIFRLLVLVVRYLPFYLLYCLSDAIAFLLYRVIGYRRRVIQDNLQKAFPHLTAAELTVIVRESYRNISDILLEAIKSFGMNAEQILVRYHIENPELANSYADNGQSVLVVAAHFANWEWGVKCLPTILRHYCIATYRPLQNKKIETYVYQSRTALGMHLFPTRETSLAFERHADQCYAMFMMPDGSPAKPELAYWVNFLGRETACIHGPAKHSQAHQLPILFLSVQRVRRGYYQCRFQTITESPRELTPTDITQQFMQALAAQINQQPANWLWTHKRWKHSKKVTE